MEEEKSNSPQHTDSAPEPESDSGDAHVLHTQELVSRIRQNPEDLTAYHELALILYRNGDVTRSLQLLEKALLIDPCDQETVSHYGRMLIDLKWFLRARLFLEQYLQLSKSKDFEVQALFEKISTLTERVSDLAKLGESLLAQGNVADAKTTLEEVVMSCADFAAAHKNLGLAHLLSGDLEQAFACSKQALHFAPAYRQEIVRDYLRILPNFS